MINQDQNCYAVINEKYIKSTKLKFNVNEIKFKLSEDRKMFVQGKEEKLKIANSFILGMHNYENILAAITTCKICGLSKESITNSINKFQFVNVSLCLVYIVYIMIIYHQLLIQL